MIHLSRGRPVMSKPSNQGFTTSLLGLSFGFGCPNDAEIHTQRPYCCFNHLS